MTDRIRMFFEKKKKIENHQPIDFVLLWVDGNDLEWQKQFYRYADDSDGDKRKCRFRDWDNLQYMFRAFEYCTPWVRKIHFVTWGHLPSWLKTDHPKINVVRHEDFLKKENLPVFSSHPLEINIHLIKGLSDKFVYFNDDMFILNNLKTVRFFKNKLPCDILSFSIISVSPIAHVKINNIQAINRNLHKNEAVRSQLRKIINPSYDIKNIFKSILLIPWPIITGFFDGHQPQPFLKSTFNEVWEKEKELLQQTSKSRIRKYSDLSQYLFRYWQLCSGNFTPVSFSKTCAKAIRNKNDANEVAKMIISRKLEMICINDLVEDDDLFEECKIIINQSFEKIFPNKSSFEV